MRVVASHYLPSPNSLPTDSNQSNFPQTQSTQYQNLFHTEYIPDEDAGNPNPFPVPTLVVGKGQSGGQLFNPVVLAEVVLPNGLSYKFSYNVYGEVDKVVYPTNAYEKYEYAATMTEADQFSQPYTQAQRKIQSRKLSIDATGNDILEWKYAEVAPTNNTGYPLDEGWGYRVTSIIAPDKTRTEIYKHNQPPPGDITGKMYWAFGLSDAKNGEVIQRKFYSTSPDGLGGQLKRREITQYEQTNNSYQFSVQCGQNTFTKTINAYRNARPTKTVSITFEGSGSALAQTSTFAYQTTYQLTTGVDQTLANGYNFAVVDNTIAQTGTIGQIPLGSLAKSTETTYLDNATYRNKNILGLQSVLKVKDAAGTIVSQSEIVYDEAVYPLIYAGTDLQWQDPTTIYRGNVTTTKSWTDISNNQFVETHAQYDNFGNLRKSWDAKGNVSEVEYSSTYNYAYPTKTISPIADASGVNGSNQVFETTTTFDFTTGLPLSVTDANGQTSTIEYNDALLRLTKTIAPNGHQTVTEYGAGTSAATRFVKVRTQIDQTKWQKGYSWYDGIGRAIKSQSVDSNGDVFTETEYDNMNRPKKATNPYRTGDTKLWTESFYDDLGRVTKLKTPDNAEVLTAYSLTTTGANIGTVVTVTDQAGKQRRSMTNGLGQMMRVDEPNDSNQLGSVDAPVQPTLYSYDTLNNLIQVGQGLQTRSFVYDSLSRLKSATNPESGLINYGYDNNGNVLSKTDARGITTSFAYDNLNRVKTRSYADGTTPPVSYYYDGIYYNAQNQLQQATGSVKGKLTGVYSIVSRTNNTAFDILGRVTAQQQITDANAYTTGYTYNLSGALIEETYPSTRVVKNVLDNDGDLAIVQSKKNANSGFFNYAKNFTYTAAGAVSSMQLGNGKWESTTFNSRLQPTQVALGTVQNGTDKLKLNYSYNTPNIADNNGNVLSQTITVPTVGSNTGFTATQTYTYDSLNRLKDAKEMIGTTQTWKQTFTFDRYGNRNFDTANTTTLGSCPANQCNPTINATNNRFNSGQGYTYDLSGNVISDAQGRTFIYDAENKQKEVKDINNISVGQYFYDGDGKRVKKFIYNTQETTIFVYDASGKLVAEYATATNTNPQVSYLTSDNLGTPRINTDANGNVIAKHDYHPFGEEIFTAQRTANLGYQADNIREKFATYQRDNELDLDFAQARYYSSKLGRFYSVDPENAGASEDDPQSWNGYAYARNNPIIFTDPDGLDVVYCDTNKVCVNLSTKEAEASLFDEQYQNSLGNTVGNGVVKDSNGNVIATYVNDNPITRLAQGTEPTLRVFRPLIYFYAENILPLFALPPGSGAAIDYLAGTAARETATQVAPRIVPRVIEAISLQGKNLEIRPDIVVKGGRSGQNVKNIVSEANSVIKGSNGRVYVTNQNGKVILDITKDRVKEVIPGRGFGPKRPPTAEEIKLIKSIWK